jgi:hypothetical protein
MAFTWSGCQCARPAGASPASGLRLTILGESMLVFELRMSGSALRNALPHNDAALDQEAADLIDRDRPLAHWPRAHTMQGQQVHLLRCFDHHETHGWSLHGFRNRFSVTVVVLVPLEERFDVLRRDQTHVVAQSGQLAADVMGTRSAP